MLVTPLHVSAPTASRGLKDQAEEKAESPQPAGFQLEEKARGNVFSSLFDPPSPS